MDPEVKGEFVQEELLLDASERGELKLVQDALNKGADIDYADKGGYTALHWAAYNQHLEIVKYLLKEGAFTYFEDKDGYRAIDVARETENAALIKIFEDREKLDLELISACKDKQYDRALELLAQGAEVNALDDDSYSPLHWAAFNGDTKLAELLLEYGADPNQADGEGVDSVQTALSEGHESVKIILEEAPNRICGLCEEYIKLEENVYGSNSEPDFIMCEECFEEHAQDGTYQDPETEEEHYFTLKPKAVKQVWRKKEEKK